MKKRQEDRFTDTQTDGEKGRDAKRQTRTDGEGRGQDETETDGQRDPGPGKRKETQRACLSNTLRKVETSTAFSALLPPGHLGYWMAESFSDSGIRKGVGRLRQTDAGGEMAPDGHGWLNRTSPQCYSGALLGE